MVFRITLLISTLALVNSLDTDWHFCPSGSFIKGITVAVDSTGKILTEVQFSCVPLETQVTDNTFQDEKLPFKNAESGTLTEREYCQRGLAIGYETKTLLDRTRLTDVRLTCVNRTRPYSNTYQTPSKGVATGDWRGETKCGYKKAVCGVQAELLKSATVPTVANLNFLCCDLPKPADVCTPKDDWSQFLERDNRKATDSLKSYYSYKTGVQMIEVTSDETSSVLAEIASSVGFRLNDEDVTTLRFKFGTKHENIKHTWSITDMSTFSAGLSTAGSTIELNIPAKYDVALQQLVGKCGPYVIWSNTIKRVDDDTSGSCIPSCAVTMFQLLAIILVVNKII